MFMQNYRASTTPRPSGSPLPPFIATYVQEFVQRALFPETQQADFNEVGVLQMLLDAGLAESSMLSHYVIVHRSNSSTAMKAD
jgi:hypothetical protein